MITGWGSHHVDIAHWGMDTELTGPISIEGKAEFPEIRAVERPRPLSHRDEVMPTASR